MKSFLAIVFLIPLTCLGQESSLEVHRIKDIDFSQGMATITFEGVTRKYTLEEDAKVMPCLWNGWKAMKEVILKMNSSKDAIIDCKLYSSGILHFDNFQGGTLQEHEDAQKAPKKPQ